MKINGAVTTFAISLLFLTGCSGNLYTVLNPDFGSPSEKNRKLKGVIVYPLKQIVVVYETRALVHTKTKEILGTAPGACEPKRSLKFGTRADFSKPYLVQYEPGLFEVNSFGVTLKDGTLASVNTTSDPTKALTALAQLLPFVTPAFAPRAGFAPSRKPFCNDQPSLVGVFEAPKTRPYEEIPQ